MASRGSCPFCSSIVSVVVESFDRHSMLQCRSCGKRWSEVLGAQPHSLAHVPRPTPAKVPLRCARCHAAHSIRIERIVTGKDASDTFVCSQCGGTWPVHDSGGRTA